MSARKDQGALRSASRPPAICLRRIGYAKWWTQLDAVANWVKGWSCRRQRRLPLRDPGHRDVGLDPAASCRLSFALYTNDDDVTRAFDALAVVVDRVRRG